MIAVHPMVEGRLLMVDGRLYNPKITWPAARGADSTTAAFVARLPRGGSPPEVVLYVKHTRVHEARRVAGTVVVAFLLEEIVYDVLRAPKLLLAHLAPAEEFATSPVVDPDVEGHAVPCFGVSLEGHRRLAATVAIRTDMSWRRGRRLPPL